MASELRITTLANNAGTESVDTTYVINGSPRMWMHHNKGPIVDSFNVSSNVDEATGQFQSNLTNSMSDNNYVTTVSCGINLDRTHSNNLTWGRSHPQTSGIVRFTSAETHNNAFSDAAASLAQYIAIGDNGS